ncbi:hypothetical protein [Croceibacterium ferulae]|uniref:hypothetical protein n=1 Tax=Croceibacterium ferulae TaxID=1854641 RepID=UPI000EB59B5F|nr:hypothetical protein [Croceibacterium ferulae]
MSRPAVSIDPAVSAFAARLAVGEAGAAAVLFYGSNLRTGSLDGVLDFYVLTDGPVERGLWPRVSYREWRHDGRDLRAKIATMHLATFAAAAAGRTLDTTIWARFVQPSALVWQRDEAGAAQVARALDAAAGTAAWLAAALGPAQGREEDYWRALFRATYRAELRVEAPGREDTILATHRTHFTGLLPRIWARDGIAFDQDGDRLIPYLSAAQRLRARRWWGRRRRMGKPLNVVRLVRAAATFDGAARYAAWKVERHTGVAVEVTPWRERHPLLSAPAMLLELARKRRSGR